MLCLNCPIGERTQAFAGLLAVLGHSPTLLLGNKTHIYSFITACIAAWQDEDQPPADVMAGLRAVLVAVRTNDPALWGRVTSKLEAGQMHTLVQLFGLQ